MAYRVTILIASGLRWKKLIASGLRWKKLFASGLRWKNSYGVAPSVSLRGRALATVAISLFYDRRLVVFVVDIDHRKDIYR